jgi:hypothetical protein
LLGHERRLAGLAALRSGAHSDSRSRGGIYTARPWIINNDTDDSEDEEIQTVQVMKTNLLFSTAKSPKIEFKLAIIFFIYHLRAYNIFMALSQDF